MSTPEQTTAGATPAADLSGNADARAERMRRWEHWLQQHQEDALLPDVPLVDAHHHLWDRGGHTYLPPQLREDARGHRVESTVYVECLSGYRDSGPEALRCVGETESVVAMLGQQAAGPDVAAGIVARADLAMGDEVADVLDAHREAGGRRFKGIRYITAWDPDPRVHGAYPTHAHMLCDPAVQAGTRQVGRCGLTLDLWLYFHQLDDVAALARACPDQTLVLDHFGGPIGVGPHAGRREPIFQQWRQAMQALAAYPNLHVKLGGLAMTVAGFGWRERSRPPTSSDLAQAWAPYFEVCLDAFGTGRCMFESNFPVDKTGCSYTVLWNAFKRLCAGLTDAERASLCSETARRVYQLPARAPNPAPPSP